MLACNDAIALFNHYHTLNKFSYVTVMKVDFWKRLWTSRCKKEMSGFKCSLDTSK